MTLTTLQGCDRPLQEYFDAALVDLDGVAYRGPHAIPTAPDALAGARDAGMSLVFVTNNASREPGSVAAHLTSLGIPAAESEVMTSAQAVAALMTDSVPAGAAVLVVGGAGLRTAIAQAGFRVVDSADDAPAAVVQGFSPDVSWTHLAEAAYAIAAGAAHFASNLDLTIPNDRGTAPGNGSLVRVVTTATGQQPPAAGKPEPAMFWQAAKKAGAARPLVIGDRLDTDLKGARSAGYPGLLVLTGVDGIREAIAAPADQRPTFIGEDLRALASPHPIPEVEGDAVRVGEAVARVVDGRLEMTGPWLDAARAGVEASWRAIDAGGAVAVESVPHAG